MCLIAINYNIHYVFSKRNEMYHFLNVIIIYHLIRQSELIFLCKMEQISFFGKTFVRVSTKKSLSKLQYPLLVLHYCCCWECTMCAKKHFSWHFLSMLHQVLNYGKSWNKLFITYVVGVLITMEHIPQTPLSTKTSFSNLPPGNMPACSLS